MSKQWQIRRGTTAENDVFTGAVGELTMDTDKNQIRLHDGTTEGGHIFGDTVVEWQAPTAENNYTWYRKYRSGWVEQGGKITNSGNSTYSIITLPIEMANIEYTVSVAQQSNGTSNPNTTFVGYKNISTTQVMIGNRGSNNEYALTQSWEVKGMAA